MDIDEDDVYFSLSNTQYKSTGPIDKFEGKGVIPLHKSHKSEKQKIVKRPVSDELKNDLRITKMRGVLDNKRFYKRNDITANAEDVQVGTVIDSPADFYCSRIPKKSRKKTLVDELLADAKFKKNIKKRYVNIIESKKHKYKKEFRTIKKRQSKSKK